MKPTLILSKVTNGFHLIWFTLPVWGLGLQKIEKIIQKMATNHQKIIIQIIVEIIWLNSI